MVFSFKKRSKSSTILRFLDTFGTTWKRKMNRKLKTVTNKAAPCFRDFTMHGNIELCIYHCMCSQNTHEN